MIARADVDLPADLPAGAPPPRGDLVARVIDRLRVRIGEERLRPGDALPSEGDMAAAFGVSRVVVREAVRSMAALGILDVGGGRRARVSAVDPGALALIMDHAVQTSQTSVQQVLDLRRTVEVRTASLAARLRTAREAAEIAEAAAAMERRIAEAEAVMEHDIAFHRAIGRASRNPIFVMVVDSLQIVTRSTWRVGWQARPSEESRLMSVRHHQVLAAAIGAQDPAAAERLMAEHFDETTRMLLRGGIT